VNPRLPQNSENFFIISELAAQSDLCSVELETELLRIIYSDLELHIFMQLLKK
jgi:hypothetical protein